MRQGSNQSDTDRPPFSSSRSEFASSSNANEDPNTPRPRGMVHRLARRWTRLSRSIRWTLGIILVVLVAFRLALPSLVRDYVNRKLNDSRDFTGSVGSIDIHLWRGAYVIRELRILRLGGEVPVPFFQTPQVDLSVQWREIFHGRIVGEIEIAEPELNFVSGRNAQESQTGQEEDWKSTIGSLSPIQINRFEVKGGSVHFRDFHSQPVVNVFVEDLSLVATNLSNTRKVKTKLPAGVRVRGQTLGEGKLDVYLQLDPLAEYATYKLEASLTNMNLVAINDFLKAYGKFDVERGTASVFTEVAAVEGRYEGYVKPVLENMDVFSWQKEKRKNILEMFWQAIVGTATTILKNQPTDRLATIIPVSGDHRSTQTDVWSAVGGVLRNAFIRALLPRIEHTVTVEEVGQGTPQ